MNPGRTHGKSKACFCCSRERSIGACWTFPGATLLMIGSWIPIRWRVTSGTISLMASMANCICAITARVRHPFIGLLLQNEAQSPAIQLNSPAQTTALVSCKPIRSELSSGISSARVASSATAWNIISSRVKTTAPYCPVSLAICSCFQDSGR